MAMKISELFSSREERLFTLFFCCVYVVLTISTVLFLRSEIHHNQILMEYEAERNSSALFETFKSDARYSDGEYNLDSITGFGVYDSRGDAIYRNGTAPADIPIQRLQDMSIAASSRFSTDRATKTISVTRPVGMGTPMMGGRGMMPRMSGMPMFVFTQIRVERYLLMQRIYTLAYFLSPLLLGFPMVLIGRLYYRNRVFSRRLEAQRNLVHLGEAARTLSHEIKNPLSAVRIQAAILKKLVPDSVHGEVDVIEEEIERMQGLVDRIGEFLRDPVGRLEPIEVDRFVEDLVRRYPGRIRIGHLDNSAVIRFDRERLRSVLENLITNALEATEPEISTLSEEPRKEDRQYIEICIYTRRTMVCISILDNGPGISDDQMGILFNPFYTTKNKGSGVGLAIAKRFTEAAGGILELASRKEGGTEALVCIPIADTEAAEDREL